MNKKIMSLIGLLLLMLSLLSVGVLAKGTMPSEAERTNMLSQNLQGGTNLSLTRSEIDGLLKMREEEKLARDVYQALYDKWNLPIFQNIATSEQTHTDAVKVLLDLYGIKDPVTSDERGVYSNEEFTKLYTSLVEQGSKSQLDALKVGATVEDLDIKDLDDLLAQTTNPDVKIVYQNLQKGSRNHIRAFDKQIKQEGGTYTAQYLSQSELDAILAGSHERGIYMDDNSDFIPGFEDHLQMAEQKQREKNHQGSGMSEQGDGSHKGSGSGNGMGGQGSGMSGQGKGSRQGAGSEQGMQGQDNENRVRMQAREMVSNCPTCKNITQENGKMYARFGNGKNVELKVLPDEASTKALRELNISSCSDNSSCRMNLKEVKDGEQTRAVYEIEAKKQTRLFGIFKVEMPVSMEIDSENIARTEIKRPWWSFLAK